MQKTNRILSQNSANFSVYQTHLEGLLIQMTGPHAWSYQFSRSGVGPENLHF